MADSYGPGDQSFQRRNGTRNSESDVVNAAPYQGYQSSSDRSNLNYPPPHNQSNPSFFKSSTNLNMHKNEDAVLDLYTSRTPSPTPSEHAMLNRKGFIDWKKLMNWRFWFRREWLWYYVILGILLVIVILISVYDRQIVEWLKPTATKIKDLPGGFLIPIAIFFVISFPPLFGHEIIAILCGVVWGLWIGFAITAAGTFLGELGNFYAFKYCCRARGEKLEKTDLQYACLAKIVRDGGFKIALVARYSAIPGHFTTAVFSTCGMHVLVFALAAFLSLPKQFVTVFIGVILKESGTGTESTKDKIISDSVLAVTVIITAVAMWYMYKKMDEVKHEVIYQRRKTRQAKLERAHSTTSSSVFNPRESDSDLPLNTGAYQHWDSRGHAAGYSGNPSLNYRVHAPTPQRVPAADVNRIPTYRSEGGGGYSTSGQRYGASDPSSASTPQAISPAHVSVQPPPQPQPQRQESGDPVGWDAAGQGLGNDMYRLPTIQPHTPLSGGFTSSPVAENNPFNKLPQLQQQHPGSSSSPAPPPLAPPPASSLHNANTYSPTASQYQSAYPLTPMSSGQYAPQQPPQTASAPYRAAVPASPSFQQHSPNVYPNPYPDSHSPLQTPTQQAFAFQPQVQQYPQSHMQGSLSQPQSPVYGQNAFAYQPQTGPATAPLSSNYSGIGAHTQEASDATAYYTPAHSRSPTDDRLPTPALQGPPEYRS